VALVSSLHFNSLVDELLIRTRGNLYTFNVLDRLAELSPIRQIRISANDVRLSQFARGWSEEHDLSQPLTAPSSIYSWISSMKSFASTG